MKVVRDMVVEHRGVITARSEVGIGTTFTIHLPLPESVQVREVAREDGIVERFEIILAPDEPLLVIDDDVEMLEQWRLEMEALGRSTLSCTCYEDFLERGMGSRLTQAAVVDYHFNNSESKGTEVIQLLRDAGFARLYLCTAEYWKPSVRKEAEVLGVRICPKPLPKVVVQSIPLPCPANGIPLRGDKKGMGNLPLQRGGEKSNLTILVLDDDPDIRKTWELQCRMWRIPTLHAYASMEECTQSDIDLQKVDMAFIDKNIVGSMWATDVIIAHLKAGGVRSVWISSGEAVSDLQADATCAAADGIVKGKIPLEIEPYIKTLGH
jgi:CheY-like chemotaxis protein